MNDIAIPVEFWKSLSDQEWKEILITSRLNHRLCRKLWAMQARIDKPPHELMVLVNKADLMRLLPPKTH